MFSSPKQERIEKEIWSIENSLEDLCLEEQIYGVGSRECLIEAFKVKKKKKKKKNNMEVKQNFYGS